MLTWVDWPTAVLLVGLAWAVVGYTAVRAWWDVRQDERISAEAMGRLRMRESEDGE